MAEVHDLPFYFRLNVEELKGSILYLAIIDVPETNSYYSIGSDIIGIYNGNPVRFMATRYGDAMPKNFSGENAFIGIPKDTIRVLNDEEKRDIIKNMEYPHDLSSYPKEIQSVYNEQFMMSKSKYQECFGFTNGDIYWFLPVDAVELLCNQLKVKDTDAKGVQSQKLYIEGVTEQYFIDQLNLDPEKAKDSKKFADLLTTSAILKKRTKKTIPTEQPTTRQSSRFNKQSPNPYGGYRRKSKKRKSRKIKNNFV